MSQDPVEDPKKPKMLHNMNYDFDVWYKTKDPVFSKISKESRLPEKWISYSGVQKGKFKSEIIKPINSYVEALYPMPKLISIESNTVTLRQENHAEIFLLMQKNGIFKNLDRPWMRQYYNTEEDRKPDAECFLGTFKFYVPWYIDEDVEVFYKSPKDDSPFCVYDTTSLHSRVREDLDYLEPDFVTFNFKKTGEHMVNERFGKIKRGSAMFDIVFQGSDIMVERVRNFYEKN
jgi:hypothetical protein